MPLPPDDNRLQPDHAPTPFSAEQIRDACRPGRSAIYLIARAGEDPVLSVGTFVEADDEGALVENQVMTRTGEPIGEVTSHRSTWTGFQAHASYPEASTTITDETVSLPAGSYDCWRYDRTADDGDLTAWFAKDIAGAPIKFEQSVAGSTIYRMTLVSITLP